MDDEQPNLDQQLAELRDTLPRMWWAMYQGAIDAGFTEKQAFTLVCVNIAKGIKIDP